MNLERERCKKPSVCKNRSYHGSVIEELLVSRHGQQVFLEDALALENTSKADKKGVFCHDSKCSLQRNKNNLTGPIIVMNKKKLLRLTTQRGYIRDEFSYK